MLFLGQLSAQKAPPLLDAMTSWVVFTNSTTLPDGTNTIYSIGQIVTTNKGLNGLCLQKRQMLSPQPEAGYHLFFDNFTTGVENFIDYLSDGTVDKCGHHTIEKTIIPSGGGAWLSPPEKLLSNLTFVEYTNVDKVNASHWHLELTTADGIYSRLEWYTAVTSGVPLLYINHSLNHNTNITMEITSAYDGCVAEYDFPPECTASSQCQGLACVTNPYATSAQIDNAINWACGDGGVTCTPILPGGDNYYPNTRQAHGDYVFGTYYSTHRQQGASACDFGGAAILHACDLGCQKCVAKANATDQELSTALDWLCSPDVLENCDAIKPGGKHYLPNTLKDHCNWAFNYYYSIFKCDKGPISCDIKGASEIQSC